MLREETEWTPVEVLDDEGNGFRFTQKDGLVMPTVFTQGDARLKQIKDLPYSEDDVLICSFPKTGTHWIYNLVHLLSLDSSNKDLVSVPPKMLDLVPAELWEVAANCPLRVTHFKPHLLPSALRKNGGKIIFLVRNPKDVVVSFYHHLTKMKSEMKSSKEISWSRFVDAWINGELPYGTYIDYYNAWEKEITNSTNLDCLVIHFEKLKQDGLNEMQRIQDFLGLHHPTEYLQAILDKCTVENMREDVQSGRTQSSLTKNLEGHSLYYRKGEVGGWKDHFTVAQNEYLDTIIEAKFKNSPFLLK